MQQHISHHPTLYYLNVIVASWFADASFSLLVTLKTANIHTNLVRAKTGKKWCQKLHKTPMILQTHLQDILDKMPLILVLHFSCDVLAITFYKIKKNNSSAFCTKYKLKCHICKLPLVLPRTVNNLSPCLLSSSYNFENNDVKMTHYN